MGQNTPAIAATEVLYLEMWAQDAAAMYGYAGSSAVAAKLRPFVEPKQITDTSGLAMQAAAVGQTVGVSASGQHSTLSQLMSTVPDVLQRLSGADASGFSSWADFVQIGKLSVPPAWTSATPLNGGALHSTLSGTPMVAPPAAGTPGMPGIPLGNAAAQPLGRAVPQYGFRPTVVARPPAGG